MKILECVALAIGTAATFFTPAAIANKVQWDLSTEYGEHSHHGEGVKMFADLVRERTDGDVNITLHYNASLGFRSKDQLDAVADGSVQIADTMALTLGGIDPIFQISGLPYFTDGSFEQARILYDIALPRYEDVLTDNNQRLLWATPWPAAAIWSTTPVTTVEDLGELKIRTYDTLSTIAYRDAGAVPVQLSWADVVPQLNTGAINGVLTSIENGLAGSFPQLLKFYSDAGINTPLNIVTINQDAFDDLTDEQREIVLEAAKEVEAFQWGRVEAREKKNVEIAREQGVTVITPVTDEFMNHLRNASRNAIDHWLKSMGGSGEELIEEFKQRISG